MTETHFRFTRIIERRKAHQLVQKTEWVASNPSYCYVGFMTVDIEFCRFGNKDQYKPAMGRDIGSY